MYKAKLISADFEESTIEFEVQQEEFSVKKGNYIIMEESEFEELAVLASCSDTKSIETKDVIISLNELSDESREILETRHYVPKEVLIKNFSKDFTENDVVQACYTIPHDEFIKQTDYNFKNVNVGVKLRLRGIFTAHQEVKEEPKE